MKKLGVVFILIVLIGAGILIGMYYDYFRVGGTYKTSTWNGKDAVLVLNKDYTCIHPSGYDATWRIKGKIIYIKLESGMEQKANIVDKGIMIGTHFFEKL